MLLAILPVQILAVVVVVVLIGVARARRTGRSPRPWGIAALVALAVFASYLLVATAFVHASRG